MGPCGLESFCLHRDLPHHPGRLVAELAGPWLGGRGGDLRRRRGRERRRAAGAGRDHELVFTDRVLVTLAVLRLQVPHAALAVMYGVHRSTVTRAVREVRPLLAGRGYATPQGQRLSTLADVFACAAASGITLRIDGSEIQVRRPPAHPPGRGAFVSGKKKMNTIRFTRACDERGRTLWDGTGRSGPAASTTRPPCRPAASMTCSISSPQSNARRTPASGACTTTTPARSASRRRSPPGTRPRRCSKRGSRPVTPSHRPGSASSTPSPTARTGGPQIGRAH